MANATITYSIVALAYAMIARTISEMPNSLLKMYMPIMLPKTCIIVLVAAYKL